MDQGVINASIELKSGTSLSRTDEIVSKIKNKIKSHPDVQKVSVKVESPMPIS